MSLLLRSLLLLLPITCTLSASNPRRDVWKARALLSPDTWSCAVEISNERKHPLYPHTTHALVFEFNKVLWLYTPYDGTQSLSLTYGTTKSDRENFLPLLKNIWSGFSSVEVDVSDPNLSRKDHTPPANACFLEAIAALNESIVPRSQIREAALLVIYFQNRDSGHTVLSYKTDEGTFVFDPSIYPKPIPVGRAHDRSPTDLARAAFPEARIENARILQFCSELLTPSRELASGKAKGVSPKSG